MFNSELTTPVLFALLIYQMQEKVDNTNHPVKYLLLSNHSAHLSLEIVNVCRKYCINLMIPTNGISTLSWWWGLRAPETLRAMPAVA
jgi:hypothetical protein